MSDIINIVNNISETTTGIVIINNDTPSVLSILQNSEQIINVIDSSGIAGTAGRDGADGRDGELVPAPPISASINLVNDEIASIVFEDGKVVSINRENGNIKSVSDGTYTKTIIRDSEDNIIQILVTEGEVI